MPKTTHGDYGSPLYKTWSRIKKRCQNPNVDSYLFYGGRGIKLCERWQDYSNFLEDLQEHPGAPLQLDRIDTNGDYEPGNVRWVSPKDNARNRRNNTLLSFNGKTQCITAWAEELGWGRHVILNRLKLGWSVEDTLTIPKGSRPGGWGPNRKKK